MDRAFVLVVLVGCGAPPLVRPTSAPPPSNPGVRVPADTSSLIEEANRRLQERDAVGAIDLARRWLDRYGEHPDVFAVVGAAQWQLGEIEQATAAYREALALDRDNYSATAGMIAVLEATGKLAEASALARGFRGGEEHETFPDIVYARTRTAYLEGEFEQLHALAPKWPTWDWFPRDQVLAWDAVGSAALSAGAPLRVVSANSDGPSTMRIDHALGIRIVTAQIDHVFTRVALSEMSLETLVSPELVARRGLKVAGQVHFPGRSLEKLDVVVLDRLEFGGGAIENVPALVTGESFEKMPGVHALIGLQALRRFDAITFDYRQGLVQVHRDPTARPSRAVAVPLVMADVMSLRAPLVPLKVGDATRWLWFGLQIVVDASMPVESVPAGRSSEVGVYKWEGTRLGELQLRPLDVAVFEDDPSAMAATAQSMSSFPVSGYFGLNLQNDWRVTYRFHAGEVWIEPRA